MKVKLINESSDKFKLKYNHGSGMNIIWKDKIKFNLDKARQSLNKWKNINCGIFNKEFQFMFFEKKIFVMPYLHDKILIMKYIALMDNKNLLELINYYLSIIILQFIIIRI